MTGQACVHHPRRPGLATCVSCGDRLCRDCIVHTTVGFKCADCTGGRQSGTGFGRRRLLAAASVAAVVAAVIGVALVRQARAPSTGEPGGG
ncbi:MAG TPA: hypothetical protein VHF25_17455, partial [Nitriliruptorales bacterium]|nr:hypothetical protein [Nitriliruptorales bacterium]